MKRHHTQAELVTLLEEIRGAAASILHLAFPDRLKIVERLPGFHRFLLTRSRCGDASNPLYRTAGWIVALWHAGMSRETAQLLVDWLQDQVDRLWPAERLDVHALSQLEQLIEGAETHLQLAYACGDVSVRPLWIAQLRRERATSTALIAALEAEEAAATHTLARAA